MYNFTDTLFLQSICKRFENCYLILGIEDPAEGCILSLSEREESLRQVQCMRQMLCIEQIICPAAEVDKEFLLTYRVDFLCTTPENFDKFSHLQLADQLVLIDRPVKLTKNDLLARVVSNKSKFLTKCLDHGYSRRQLGVSLYEKIMGKVQKFVNSTHWNSVKGQLAEVFLNKGRRFYKKILKRMKEFEEGLNESLYQNFEE
jgi:hypothetical protein